MCTGLAPSTREPQGNARHNLSVVEGLRCEDREDVTALKQVTGQLEALQYFILCFSYCSNLRGVTALEQVIGQPQALQDLTLDCMMHSDREDVTALGQMIGQLQALQCCTRCRASRSPPSESPRRCAPQLLVLRGDQEVAAA